MRTRSGSDYKPPTQSDNSARAKPTSRDVQPAISMELDALDAAITALDINGPVTNEALAQLLRGLALTLTNSFNATIAKKDAQISDLQMRVVALEECCDNLEQYSRRNTLRIRGLPEAIHEDTDDLVKELAARKLEVQVADHDVVRSHRVGKRSEDRGTPRDVIVRFTTHNKKRAIMKNARKLKGSKLFINEDMTKARATMAWEARNLKREGKITDTWTRDGVIFVKLGENRIKSFTATRAWREFTGKL